MGHTMGMSAWARIEDSTEITFLTCHDGCTEFTFDREAAGLVLDASERGLHNLAKAVNAAVADRHAKAEAESAEKNR